MWGFGLILQETFASERQAIVVAQYIGTYEVLWKNIKVPLSATNRNKNKKTKNKTTIEWYQRDTIGGA